MKKIIYTFGLYLVASVSYSQNGLESDTAMDTDTVKPKKYILETLETTVESTTVVK